jgi:hypothetical protein
VAIFQVIDTSSSGDDFDVGMIKDAANWATMEATFATATEAGVFPFEFDINGDIMPIEV